MGDRIVAARGLSENSSEDSTAKGEAEARHGLRVFTRRALPVCCRGCSVWRDAGLPCPLRPPPQQASLRARALSPRHFGVSRKANSREFSSQKNINNIIQRMKLNFKKGQHFGWIFLATFRTEQVQKVNRCENTFFRIPNRIRASDSNPDFNFRLCAYVPRVFASAMSVRSNQNS